MSENLNFENENNETETLAEESATATQSAPDAAKVQPAENVEAEATSAVVKIEGQEFPLPTSIAADDELLKTALSPHYPSIKNANIAREIRAGQMIVSIVKRAEHKGWVRKNGKKSVKTKSKKMRRERDATDIVLRRLITVPETAHQIYELAESLYLRSCNDSGDAATGRMTPADIERIGKYLREVETDDREMKKQFAELASLTSEFHSPKIPVGF